MKSLILLAFIFSTTLGLAEKVLFVGHSLINHNMPQMLGQLAGSAKLEHESKVQIINGAPLKHNWENSAKAEGVDARALLEKEKVDVFVMTEAVPLDNHLKWSDSHGQAKKFSDLAHQSDKNTRIFIFETWHCINSGTDKGCAYDKQAHVPWRKRLDDDLAKWQKLADAAGNDCKLIPGGQALAKLHDKIAAKKVPGLSKIQDVFADDIHMNDIGNYYMACLHFAVIYGKSPVGLTAETKNQWGKPYKSPTAEQAEALQKLAWQVACDSDHD